MEPDLKQKILEDTIEEFKKHGFKFTMDDIAKSLKISKKTIYTLFQDKEALFLEMVDYVYQDIKSSEARVMADASLTTIEKLKKILVVMPERYREIDWRQMYQLEKDFPAIYRKLQDKLEGQWDMTIALIHQGKQEGIIKDIPVPIIKVMFEAAMEKYVGTTVLIDNDMCFEEAVNDTLNVLMRGIEVR